MKRKTSIAGAVVGSVVKSILFAAIVIAIAIALMRISPLLGTMALLLFSGIMLVSANRKDIPLNVFTALLPGGVALLSYALQLILVGVDDLLWPLIGVLAGLLPGWLVGRGHRIYIKDRQVFAHRTSGTILLWVVIYLIGQGATLLGLRQILPVAIGLGGFSTTIVVVLSVILFRKALAFRSGGAVPAGAAASWAAILAVSAGLVLSIVPPGPARAEVTVGSALEGLQHIVQTINQPLPQIALGPKEVSTASIEGMPAGSSRADVAFTSSQSTERSDKEAVIISIIRAPGLTSAPGFSADMQRLAEDTDCQWLSGATADVLVVCKSQTIETQFMGIAIVGDWMAQIGVLLNGGDGARQSYVRQFTADLTVEVARAMGDLRFGSGSQSLVPPVTALPDVASGVGQALDQIAAILGGSGYVSQDAIDAGIAAAIAQLLAGAGLAAATAAAQAPANATQAAISAAASVGNTRILEGADAIDWLQNHRFPGGSDNFLDDDGHATNNFTAWLDLAHSSTNPTGLLGFAGDLDAHNNPTPDRIAITVLNDDIKPVKEVPPVEPVQLEFVEPVPPVEPDKPEPEKTPQDEKKEPAPADPCAGLRDALRQVELEVTKIGNEVRRLGEECDTLQRAYDNKWWAAFTSFHVDMISAMVSLNLTRLPPGSAGGHPLTSVGQSLLVEAIKHGINEYFEQNPSARDTVKSSAVSGGIATSSEVLKAAWEYALKKAARFDIEAAGRLSSDIGLEQQLAHHFAAVVQAFSGSFLAGRELSQKGMELGLLKSRVEVVDQLKTHTEKFFDDAEARRAAAQAALDACEKSNPPGGTI